MPNVLEYTKHTLLYAMSNVLEYTKHTLLYAMPNVLEYTNVYHCMQCLMY